MSKYKIGDHLRIRRLEITSEVRDTAPHYDTSMKSYQGKSFKAEDFNSGGYVRAFGYVWNDKWIEPVKNSISIKDFKEHRNGKA